MQTWTEFSRTPIKNTSTGQCAIWFLKNGIFSSSVYLPTVRLAFRVRRVPGSGRPTEPWHGWVYGAATGGIKPERWLNTVSCQVKSPILSNTESPLRGCKDYHRMNLFTSLSSEWNVREQSICACREKPVDLAVYSS